MLVLSEKAKEKVKQMIKEEGENYYLRIYAIPAGCCGLDFGMELTNEIDSSDTFIEFGDFKVVVDDFSYPFVENLKVDIVDKEGKSYFVIDMEKSNGCGCGCGCSDKEDHSCGCGNGSCGCH